MTDIEEEVKTDVVATDHIMTDMSLCCVGVSDLLIASHGQGKTINAT